jgi:hypothetical protein
MISYAAASIARRLALLTFAAAVLLGAWGQEQVATWLLYSCFAACGAVAWHEIQPPVDKHSDNDQGDAK